MKSLDPSMWAAWAALIAFMVFAELFEFVMLSLFGQSMVTVRKWQTTIALLGSGVTFYYVWSSL